MLEALSRMFIEPPGDAAVVAPPPPLVPPAAQQRLAVVCAEDDGPVAAGAAGLAAAAVAGCGFALLVERGLSGETLVRDRLPARAARRGAEALRTQGHTAQAAGRLVHVALPAEGLSQLAAMSAPVVLVAAGPRDDRLEALLAQQTRLLLVARAGLDPELLALAQEELVALGPAVETVELASAPAAAALARSGTALVAPLRAPFLAAVRPGEAPGADHPAQLRLTRCA